MTSITDNVQQMFRQVFATAMRINRWVRVIILIGIVYVLLGLLNGSRVEVTWGPVDYFFCRAPYAELQNQSLWPLATDNWRFGDQRTQYQLPHRWLPPGSSVRLWPGNGTDDDLNLYAGGTGRHWYTSFAWVDGLPNKLHQIGMQC